MLPCDSVRLTEHQEVIDKYHKENVDLNWLREKIRKGMRNSNVMAIAPTATIANIIGVRQSIEPYYNYIYKMTNLSGDFTVINNYLYEDLVK